MKGPRFSIGRLAEAAGISRRAVRFYVQQGLLPPPHGRGRGSGYDQSHLQRLGRIRELQAAGHSLEAVRLILQGRPARRPAPPAQVQPARPVLAARLWTRLQLAEGLELHLDTRRFNPDVNVLMAIRQAIRNILNQDDGQDGPSDPQP